MMVMIMWIQSWRLYWRPTIPPLRSHCAGVPPIAPFEFYVRQHKLAHALSLLNATAYIAEPGASAEYYGNISSSHWHLSERPLLLIITPKRLPSGQVEPKVTVLTPSFEATRAKQLPIPVHPSFKVQYVEWPEEADPYSTALRTLALGNGVIYVDGMMRAFNVDGLRAANPNGSVASAPIEVRRIRERKSNAELEIMRCANEVTVLAIRGAKSRMHFGMKESEGRDIMRLALLSAGLQNPWTTVLFGENAALPHGGGTDRVLTKHDLILIDTGGSLHGYQSDVTRTFALDGSILSKFQEEIWHNVRAAQVVALEVAGAEVRTGVVDETTRAFLRGRGDYAKFFTHRLGHGIGLEGHESPYLRGGNTDIIETGHTFSNEPGIYIEGKAGVRLEDCFYIDHKWGKPVLFTAGVGGLQKDPFHP